MFNFDELVLNTNSNNKLIQSLLILWNTPLFISILNIYIFILHYYCLNFEASLEQIVSKEEYQTHRAELLNIFTNQFFFSFFFPFLSFSFFFLLTNFNFNRFRNARIERNVLWFWYTINHHKYRKNPFTNSYVFIQKFRIS